jgi:predicted secreted acid phosphatase
MKRISSYLLGMVLITAVSCSFAAEPTNLSIAKKSVRRYHDSGEYVKDINTVGNRALAYLEKRVAINNFHQQKPAIVLDIDETSLSNYPDMDKMDFGGTMEQITAAENQAKDPAIETTLKLYNYAKAHNIAVIFLTGRAEKDRAPTEQNLTSAGYQGWEKLILRDGEFIKAPAAVYKTATRKELKAQGYDILLNMGDQFSDLRGGFADKTFKLPNPYYIIP